MFYNIVFYKAVIAIGPYILQTSNYKSNFCSVMFELLCNGNPQPEVKWILISPKGERELNGEGYMNKMKKQVGKYVCNLIIKVTEIFVKNLNWQKMIEEKIWVIITNKYLKIILFAVIQKSLFLLMREKCVIKIWKQVSNFYYFRT